MIKELYKGSSPFVSSFTIFTTAWVLYLVAKSIYRLYLSPIAKFPGPKLAVISFW